MTAESLAGRESDAARRYLAIFLTSAAGFAVLLVLFNVLIDPFGLFRIVTVPGLNNDRRPALESWHRHTREIEILRRRPDVLVLGTSRELYGIEPQRLVGSFGQRPHNAAIAAASIPELEATLVAGLRLARPQHILIGLDYFSFDDKRDTGFVPNNGSLAIAVRNTKLVVRSTATFRGLEKSIETILASRCRPVGEEYPADGHRDIGLALKPCGKAAPGIPAPEAIANVAGMFNFDKRANAMASIERIMAICVERRIDCRLFIGPMSGAYLTVLFDVDWAGFQAWKRDLSALSERFGVAVADFSGAMAASTLPLAQEPDRFYDSLHFGPGIGGSIVAALAASADSDSTANLRAENLAALRMRDEETIRRFEANAPEFVARLRSALRARPASGSQ